MTGRFDTPQNILDNQDYIKEDIFIKENRENLFHMKV